MKVAVTSRYFCLPYCSTYCMCCHLRLKSRSWFPPFLMFEINWWGLFLPQAKVDLAYTKSVCSDTSNTGSKEEFLSSELFLAGELPLLVKPCLEMCSRSFAGIVRSTETAASYGRTTPVLRGSCQQGPERRDPLVPGAASWGQELQNLLCSHSTWLNFWSLSSNFSLTCTSNASAFFLPTFWFSSY